MCQAAFTLGDNRTELSSRAKIGQCEHLGRAEWASVPRAEMARAMLVADDDHIVTGQ